MDLQIRIGGELTTFQLIDLDNDSFEVFNKGNRLGVIFPEFTDDCDVKWCTFDLIAPSILEQIGDRLEALNS